MSKTNIDRLKKYILDYGFPKMIELMKRNQIEPQMISVNNYNSIGTRATIVIYANGTYRMKIHNLADEFFNINNDANNDNSFKKYSRIFEENYFFDEKKIDWTEMANIILNNIDDLINHEKKLFELMHDLKNKNIDGKYIFKELIFEKNGY